MRPENILTWSINVELGAPPPSQPPFDQFGNPVVNIAANIKEWKREFQAQQAERTMLERGSGPQNPNGPKIGSTKADIEAYIKDWKGASKAEDTGREVSNRVHWQQNPYTLKPGCSNNLDGEARLNDWKHATMKQQRENTECERMLRERKMLFPNSVPKEEVKPESKAFKIPQVRRKPVPKANEDTTATHPTQRKPGPRSDDKDTLPRALHPKTLLLRNGEMRRMENRETKTIENKASYTERIRELGYPEALCPLGTPMKELGVDCTGAKVIRQDEERQLRHENRKLNTQGYGEGSQAEEEIRERTPEMMALAGEFRTLKVGVKRG